MKSRTAQSLKQRAAYAAVQFLLLTHAWAVPIAYEQVPAAVQKGIATQLAGGKLGAIDRDEDNGQVTYTFEVTRGGNALDYTVDARGALVSVEIALTDAPLPVQKTVQAQVGAGMLQSIEKTFQDGKVVYDVEWKTPAGMDRSFTVLPDGQLDSRQVGLEEAPAAVRETIAKECGPGTLKEVFKTLDDNTVYYDATILRDGVQREISIGEDGQVESRQVFLKEVPAPAQSTIQQTLGTAHLVRIDQMPDKKKGFVFEIEAVKSGKTFYFTVGRKGALLDMD